jgi:hypothetical protein
MDYECRIRDAEILAYPPVIAGIVMKIKLIENRYLV